jgi:hypothetical protein
MTDFERIFDRVGDYVVMQVWCDGNPERGYLDWDDA